MDKRVLACFSVLLPLHVVAEVQDLEVEHYAAIAGNCIATEDPLGCLQSYGYVCDRSNGTNISVAAYRLGCNADLSNNRKHFAQFLVDGVGWAVEVQRAYVPEQYQEPDEPTEPEFILDAYIQSQVEDDELISGGISSFHMGRAISVHVGSNTSNNSMAFRAICGIVVIAESDASASIAVKEECEKRVLRAIMKFGQPDQQSPFRAAGAREIRWGETMATLDSKDSVLILEARYEFPEGHVSCRKLPYCCSRSGSLFLDSCREPKDSEEAAINVCLAEGLSRRSVEYSDCLRSNGVNVGCEVQGDGSRLCY